MMIAKNSYNRKVITTYLETLSEDDFIDEVIIPFFNQNGYFLYRRNIHGPGEHGKDLVFYRHVKLFFDNEYIVVQAKAEKVTSANVGKMADQLIRALKVPFTGKSRGPVYANYVLFINARAHTNDANFEFYYLADMKDNIKILSQENILELLFESDLIPTALREKLEEYEMVSDTFSDRIRAIILSNDSIQITNLLDGELKIETRQLSHDVKGLIINYIFKVWTDDPTWNGTVKPMQWLRFYFDFIQTSQYTKLLKVIEEYTSSHPSHAAQVDTSSVVSKITPDQLRTFQQDFAEIVINHVRNRSVDKFPLIIAKWKELAESGFLAPELKSLNIYIERAIDLRKNIKATKDESEKEGLRKEYRKIDDELYYFLYPDERPRS